MNDRYALGPDVTPNEELYDSHGNRIDENYVDQAVTGVHRSLGGHPSLSGQRIRSPQIAFGFPPRNATKRARAEGVTPSEDARQALEERLHRAS